MKLEKTDDLLAAEAEEEAALRAEAGKSRKGVPKKKPRKNKVR